MRALNNQSNEVYDNDFYYKSSQVDKPKTVVHKENSLKDKTKYIFYTQKDFFHIALTILSISLLWLPIILLSGFNSVFYYFAAGLASFILICFMLFIRYEINEKHLVSRFLFIKLEVKLDRIKTVTICKNFRSSFATSLERLEISYGFVRNTKRTRFYISPKNQDEFLEVLSKRCPNMNIVEQKK